MQYASPLLFVKGLCADLERLHTQCLSGLHPQSAGNVRRAQEKKWRQVAQSHRDGRCDFTELIKVMRQQTSSQIKKSKCAIVAVRDSPTPRDLLQAMASHWRAWYQLTQFASGVLALLAPVKMGESRAKRTIEGLLYGMFHSEVYVNIRGPVQQIWLERVDEVRDASAAACTREIRCDADLSSCAQMFDLVEASPTAMRMPNVTMRGPRPTAKPTSQLEPAYLERVQEFYARTRERQSLNGVSTEYLSWVRDTIDAETRLAHQLLPPECKSSVRQRLEAVLVEPYSDAILCHRVSGFEALIARRDFSQLFEMYMLVPQSQPHIDAALVHYTETDGDSALKTLTSEVSLVHERHKLRLPTDQSTERLKKLRAVVCTAIIRQIDWLRGGNEIQIHFETISQAVSAMVQAASKGRRLDDTDSYKREWEKPYVVALMQFYKCRGNAVMSSDDGAVSYASLVEEWQRREESLAAQLLCDRSLNRLRTVADDAMIEPHYEMIVHHPACGLCTLLDQWQLDDIHRMYQLMKRVSDQKALLLMGKILQAHALAEATAIVHEFDPAGSDGLLTLEREVLLKIVALDAKYESLSQECFEGDWVLCSYLKTAFEKALTQPLPQSELVSGGAGKTTCAQLLVSVCDAAINGKLVDAGIDATRLEWLDVLLKVFSHIADDAQFRDLFGQRLAVRLLRGTAQEAPEKALYQRLKRHMGKSFTYKMQTMLQEKFERDSNQNDEFKLVAAAAGLPCDFSVDVLTHGHWPALATDTVLVFPALMRRCMDAFTGFYKNKFGMMRKLMWVYTFGTAELRITFAKGAKIVTATLCQAAVLLTIDNAQRISADDLGRELGVDLPWLLPHLRDLMGMLRRVNGSSPSNSMAPSVGSGDVLELDDNFTHRTRKITLPMARASPQRDRCEKTGRMIDEQPSFAVDANLTRVMRAETVLPYAELLRIVLDELDESRVSLTPQFVRRRVERLVECEVLRWHDDDASMVQFVPRMMTSSQAGRRSRAQSLTRDEAPAQPRPSPPRG